MASDRRKLLVAAALSTGLMAASAAPALAGGEACRHAQRAAEQKSMAGRALTALSKLVAAGGGVTLAAMRERAAPGTAPVAAMTTSCRVGNGKKPMYDAGACVRDLQVVVATNWVELDPSVVEIDQ